MPHLSSIPVVLKGTKRDCWVLKTFMMILRGPQWSLRDVKRQWKPQCLWVKMLNHRAAEVWFTEAAEVYSKSTVPQEHKPGEEPKPCYLGNEDGLGRELTAQIYPYLGSMLSVIKIILEHRHIIKTVNRISERLLQKAIVWEVIAFPRRKYILTTEEGKQACRTQISS